MREILSEYIDIQNATIEIKPNSTNEEILQMFSKFNGKINGYSGGYSDSDNFLYAFYWLLLNGISSKIVINYKENNDGKEHHYECRLPRLISPLEIDE